MATPGARPPADDGKPVSHAGGSGHGAHAGEYAIALVSRPHAERKRILRPRGRTDDGSKNRYEHARTKQIFELPADELTPEFFIQVQEQLSLVGGPKTGQ